MHCCWHISVPLNGHIQCFETHQQNSTPVLSLRHNNSVFLLQTAFIKETSYTYRPVGLTLWQALTSDLWAVCFNSPRLLRCDPSSACEDHSTLRSFLDHLIFFFVLQNIEKKTYKVISERYELVLRSQTVSEESFISATQEIKYYNFCLMYSWDEHFRYFLHFSQCMWTCTEICIVC